MLHLPAFHAMVLSAGFGTRLAPLTDEIPKPLVPIGDTPLLGTTLATLNREGAGRLVVNVHHHHQKISNYIKCLPFSVHVSHEQKILGTAGGISQAREYLRGAPVLLVNGDIVGELPIRRLLEAEVAPLRLAIVPRALGKGTVGVGARGEVVRLRGEIFGNEVASGDYMGVARLEASCLETLPAEGCLIGDWGLPALRAGQNVQTATIDLDFEDVGTIATYLDCNQSWLRESLREQSEGASYVGQGAHIGQEVQLISSVVGAGCSVEGQGKIESCVILPGAHAVAPLFRSVVTPGGVVISASKVAPVETQD